MALDTTLPGVDSTILLYRKLHSNMVSENHSRVPYHNDNKVEAQCSEKADDRDAASTFITANSLEQMIFNA